VKKELPSLSKTLNESSMPNQSSKDSASLAKKVEPSASTKLYLESLQAPGKRPVHSYPPAEARRLYSENSHLVTAEAPEIASSHDQTIPGPHGLLPIRIYRPMGSTPNEILPAFIFFHGGGWMLGNLETHDVICRKVCNQAHCSVIAVDYRLAPEFPFPIAVEEAIFATQWIFENAKALALDANRMAIGGDSAGGALSATVALDAVPKKQFKLVLQVLIYPSVDQEPNYPSYEENGTGYFLDRDLLHFFQSNYLTPKDYLDWRASPIRAKSFVGLPPAFILTAGYDPLRDEGKDYGDRLRAAGVPVTYSCYEDMIHGFVRLGKVIPEAQNAIDEISAELTKAFAAKI
jgi:acetyl esterase